MLPDMVVTTSPLGVRETIDRITQILSENDWALIEYPVVARFDLREYGRQAKFPMQVELLMFDYPNKWGFLMNENPAIGIEWPLKILAWQDEQGATRVGYTKPAVLLERYKLKQQEFSIENIENLMANITAELVGDI